MTNSNIQNINDIQIGNSLPLTPSRPIIPRKGNIDAGSYDSEIVKIEPVYSADGDITAVDFFHELTNSDGSKILVRFRYYYKFELPKLLDIFASYGIKGGLGNAVGTKETIEVSEAENSSYMKISDRKLKPKTGGLLSSKRSPIRKPPSQATNLLNDDEDDEDEYDEYDDFADFDDDDFIDATEDKE